MDGRRHVCLAFQSEVKVVDSELFAEVKFAGRICATLLCFCVSHLHDACRRYSTLLTPSMSATVKDAVSPPSSSKHDQTIQTPSVPKGGNYKGFVAGVFSGIAKLSVGYVDALFLYTEARTNNALQQPSLRHNKSSPTDLQAFAIPRAP